MALHKGSKSAEVRARVDHPIVDIDGHYREFTPLDLEYILDLARQIGGTEMVDRVRRTQGLTLDQWLTRLFAMSEEERRDTRTPMFSWWNHPTHDACDFATSFLPAMLHERMDELGIDYSVLYPTYGLGGLYIQDGEVRRVVCRALNTLYAERFRPYADRMTPAALIPMYTPQEAIEELEYAVKTLGLKAILINGHVWRPVPKIAREHPELATVPEWMDAFGIDSEYDYDPFWAKCVELQVAPTQHSSEQGKGLRASISSYTHNHVGGIAAAHEAQLKALVLGGVTRRFPTLKFGLLEGGVGWACRAYADLFGHWEKRNSRTIQAMNPARLDTDAVLRYIEQYADAHVKGKTDAIRAFLKPAPLHPAELDDWARAGVESAEDFHDRIIPHFYFGCEADDPMNALAFQTKLHPFGAKFRIVFGSDISHWDAPLMNDVVAEAYELVEKDLITGEDFRDFMFTNAVTLYGATNPRFFEGTRIEAEARRLLDTRPPDVSVGARRAGSEGR